jgi:acetolactate synthase I/II/III large subunit
LIFQEDIPDMSDKSIVGEVIAAFLEECGVGAAFGVISIHNMPFLDAIGKRGKIRYVSARGEAGAVNMADAYARVGQRLGVAFTSTGVAAGNAAGSMVEALTAGTPVLHITGQIETPHLDKNHSYIHEARDQLSMLKAVSKKAYRVVSPETALDTFKEAVCEALTAPTGPVSVEVPIDIQHTLIDWPEDLNPLPIATCHPDDAAIADLATRLVSAKRPLLWLGGGARHASAAVERLVNMGFGVVTSVQGRGIIREDHPQTLAAFNMYGCVEKFYGTCDAMLVVGSRLRGNETLKYKLKLPNPLYQIDVDTAAKEGRPYIAEHFVQGDSALALAALADALEGQMKIDPAFAADLKATRAEADTFMREGLLPYDKLVDVIQASAGDDFVWARDVTVSNSTWGNRGVLISGPYDGVHALGGGIGQGMQMAIGAAIAAPERQVFCLVGDGGLQVNIGELATAAQEGVNIVMVLMNSHDYEVIKNIQNAEYGGRLYYSDILTPDFKGLAESNGWSYQVLSELKSLQPTFDAALSSKQPSMIEVDMPSIGPFAKAFGGPPVKKQEEKVLETVGED